MKTLIFAGNAREAAQWAHEHQVCPRDRLYVASEAALRGYSTGRWPRVFLGSFRDRRDASDLLRALEICDLHG